MANDVPKEDPSIILLDDANELSGLEGFADFVSNRGNIKVFMTVRNYAFEHVKSSISKFCRPYLYEVNQLDEETALNVVEEWIRHRERKSLCGYCPLIEGQYALGLRGGRGC